MLPTDVLASSFRTALLGHSVSSSLAGECLFGKHPLYPLYFVVRSLRADRGLKASALDWQGRVLNWD